MYKQYNLCEMALDDTLKQLKLPKATKLQAKCVWNDVPLPPMHKGSRLGIS